jgi:hypothetical protein
LAPKLGNSQVLIEGESSDGKIFKAMITIILGHFKAENYELFAEKFSVLGM